MLHGNAGYSVIQPGMAGPPGRSHRRRLRPAVENVKPIKDKATGNSSGYGFVDFYDNTTAGLALQALNGRYVYGYDLKVNWAFAGGQREDTSGHFHIFVGDLSSDVDDRALFGSFQQFGSISDARVMWDQATGRSRGYGFVAFRLKEDAERAIEKMNGEWVGTRRIRVNWGNNKAGDGRQTGDTQDYASVVAAAPSTNATVYVGNLPPEVSEQNIRSVFSENGFNDIQDIRIQADKGFAFVKMRDHERAARAIVAIHGRTIAGRSARCSWGKEKLGPATFPSGPPLPGAYTTTVAFPGVALYPSPSGGYSAPPGAYDAQAAGAYDPQTAAAYAAYYAQYYPQYAHSAFRRPPEPLSPGSLPQVPTRQRPPMPSPPRTLRLRISTAPAPALPSPWHHPAPPPYAPHAPSSSP
eukprot:tig00001181_g7425.t1